MTSLSPSTRWSGTDVAGAWHDVDWRPRTDTPAGRVLAQAALLSAR